MKIDEPMPGPRFEMFLPLLDSNTVTTLLYFVKNNRRYINQRWSLPIDAHLHDYCAMRSRQ